MFFRKHPEWQTLATLAASSVGSVGKAEELLSWNSTTVGLETAFASHNDNLLIIDDLNKLRAESNSAKYAQVRNVAYTLLTGSDRRRHPSYAAGRQTGVQFRLISMTSSEEAIHKLAARVGETRGGGAVRLIDVPACFNNLSHIFDLAPNSSTMSPHKLQQRFEGLIHGCADNQWAVIEGYACFANGRRECVVRVENFNRVFEDELQRQLVLDWLVAKKKIVMANTKGGKQRLPQEQFLWPDKARRRSYKINGLAAD